MPPLAVAAGNSLNRMAHHLPPMAVAAGNTKKYILLI
jgi:hypothetical protein